MDHISHNTVINKSNWYSSYLQQWCEKLVCKQLNCLQGAYIQLYCQYNGQHFEFGQPDSELKAKISVYDPQTWVEMVKNGSIGAAKAYIEGMWSSSNLTGMMQVFAHCQRALDSIENNTSWWQSLRHKLLHWQNRNTREGSKRNILAHYDLGNELYRHFLDPGMMYSSAIYPNEHSSLDEAQQFKLQTICERLQLCADDHLLEIGSGWGGLAIYAASHYGCRVTTTTISDAQYEYAKMKITDFGLADKITLLKKDYRDLQGRYDKLVSIEMIEAVGHVYHQCFFAQCEQLLKPGGRMLLQSITIADQRYEHYKSNVDFIQYYIFPGGCLPSISVLANQIATNTTMVIEQVDDIGLDYARTLADWRQRFDANWDKLQKLGYDEAFKRLWHFYLSYCEGAFLARAISTVHLVARK